MRRSIQPIRALGKSDEMHRDFAEINSPPPPEKGQQTAMKET